jgi:molybdenum cofactor cytidylyltransferase
VILAAGGSQRMGCPKQMLPFRGHSLIRHAVEIAVASECRPILVTIGAHEDLVRQELQGLPVLIAHNPDWAQGMSSSLRVATATLARVSDIDIEGVVITLADQPLVTAHDINRLVEVHHHTGTAIVASEYADTHGVPMFISAQLFPEVAALNGNEGAKRLIARHLEQVATVPLLDAALDIDTPADYERVSRV